jgi:F-type H+-transporting ATPase subunit b
MNSKRRMWLVAGVSVCLLMAAASASAAEGEETLERSTEIFKWVNFAIVAGLLIWAFGKLLPPVFRRRADEIGSAITKATAVREEAHRQLAEAERRLRRIDEEVGALRATAKQEAAAEAERIRAMSQADVQKVKDVARAEIAAAERAARNGLRQLTAKLAVDGAESLLARQMNAQAQDALIASFVSHVGSQAGASAGKERPN